jgi:membrane fusion protein (multidrug efflux system)
MAQQSTALHEIKAEAASPQKTKINKKMIGIIAAVIVLSIGSWMLYNSLTYVSTDNASVEGRAILIAAKVGGLIVKSDVQENQKVKKGDLLAEIRVDDYQNALAQAEAQLSASRAQLVGAESNYRRILNLFKGNAYSKDKLDVAESQYKSLLSQVKAAESAVAQAKLNLEYTKIVAPADGRVAKKSFEVGTLANMGTPLMGFVYDDERWVVANMKETDMAHIVPGRPAYVDVDAIPGRSFEGSVESISPSTGATFSMLPPDNATGNFTKVVQRVPVRIKLKNLSEQDIDRLQAGLSVEVSIKIR